MKQPAKAATTRLYCCIFRVRQLLEVYMLRRENHHWVQNAGFQRAEVIGIH